MDILGNPNVLTILPHQIKTEDDYDIDFNVTDSQIVWDEGNKDLVPLEFDSNKGIMTDDGDLILTEPDNKLKKNNSFLCLMIRLCYRLKKIWLI